MIREATIKEALAFYQIDEKGYEKSCFSCLEKVEKDLKLKERLGKLYQEFYLDEKVNLGKYWEKDTPKKLFARDTPLFITNLLVLLGYQVHEENMRKYHLLEEQIKLHKKRVKEILLKDIKERGLLEIRTSQMLWGIYFINLRLIEVAGLQYENVITNQEEIQIHIPSDANLKKEKVQHSLTLAKEEVARYFHKDKPRFGCNSWLLSRQVRKLVRADSNIASFYSMFWVTEGEEGLKDILNFVYQVDDCKDYASLPEHTTLQKAIKEFLLAGNKIYLGKGQLKN